MPPSPTQHPGPYNVVGPIPPPFVNGINFFDDGDNMATSLLKLSMTATQPTTTAKPTTYHYFRTAPAQGYTGAATYTIDDVDWVNDSGVNVAEGALVPATENNGFYQLFINGELQEGNVLTSVSATAVVLTFGETTTIDAGKIIALTVTNFDPNTTAPTITG